MCHIVDMKKEEWLQYRKRIIDGIQSINIESDVNPMTAIVIISRIDKMYSSLRIDYSEVEATKERIDTSIKEIERVGLTGKNEDERRRNAVMAVMEAKDNNEMSLYDIQREANERYLFLKGVIDVLINKQNRLITINGLLKIDSNTLTGEAAWAKNTLPA